jgi:methylated-DNA-protein-cysteine methyltransferase-like protein
MLPRMPRPDPSKLSASYTRIYAVVRRIPRGKVATYGQVADVAGMHGSARLVGYALHASKDHHGLPWHRVIAAGGRLTLAKLDPEAALTQRIRLEHEGVRFTPRGSVDLEAHQWRTGRGRERRA